MHQPPLSVCERSPKAGPEALREFIVESHKMILNKDFFKTFFMTKEGILHLSGFFPLLHGLNLRSSLHLSPIVRMVHVPNIHVQKGDLPFWNNYFVILSA